MRYEKPQMLSVLTKIVISYWGDFFFRSFFMKKSNTKFEGEIKWQWMFSLRNITGWVRSSLKNEKGKQEIWNC